MLHVFYTQAMRPPLRKNGHPCSGRIADRDRQTASQSADDGPWSAADTQRDVHLTDLALNLRPVVETPWRWITNDLPFWYVV